MAVTECPIHNLTLRCTHFDGNFMDWIAEVQTDESHHIAWSNRCTGFGTVTLLDYPLTDEIWDKWIVLYKSGHIHYMGCPS